MEGPFAKTELKETEAQMARAKTDGSRDLIGQLDLEVLRAKDSLLTVLARRRPTVEEWLRPQELQAGSVIEKAMAPARAMSGVEVAAELRCPRFYSIGRAYEWARCSAEWPRPAWQSNSKCRSELDWSLAEERLGLDGDRESDSPRSGEEILEEAKRRAAPSRRLQVGREGTGGANRKQVTAGAIAVALGQARGRQYTAGPAADSCGAASSRRPPRAGKGLRVHRGL